jgi:hypothetical protein
LCGRKERKKEVGTEDAFLCWARDALFGRKCLWLSKMLSGESEVKMASRVPRVNNDWRQQPRSENRPNATHPCQKNTLYSYTSSRRRRRTKLGMGILMYCCCKSYTCLLWGQRASLCLPPRFFAPDDHASDESTLQHCKTRRTLRRRLLWPQMIAAARNFRAVQGTKSRLGHNATSFGTG